MYTHWYGNCLKMDVALGSTPAHPPYRILNFSQRAYLYHISKNTLSNCLLISLALGLAVTLLATVMAVYGLHSTLKVLSAL